MTGSAVIVQWKDRQSMNMASQSHWEATALHIESKDQTTRFYNAHKGWWFIDATVSILSVLWIGRDCSLNAFSLFLFKIIAGEVLLAFIKIFAPYEPQRNVRNVLRVAKTIIFN